MRKIAPVFERELHSTVQRIKTQKILEEVRVTISAWNGDIRKLPPPSFWRQASEETIALAGYLKPTKKKQRTLEEALGIIDKFGIRHSYWAELNRLVQKFEKFPRNRLLEIFEAAQIECDSREEGSNCRFIELINSYRAHRLTGGRWNKEFERKFQEFREYFPKGMKPLQDEVNDLLLDYSDLKALVPLRGFLQQSGVITCSPLQKHVASLQMIRKKRDSNRKKKQKYRKTLPMK